MTTEHTSKGLIVGVEFYSPKHNLIEKRLYTELEQLSEVGILYKQRTSPLFGW
jgi:hypothetical protein